MDSPPPQSTYREQRAVARPDQAKLALLTVIRQDTCYAKAQFLVHRGPGQPVGERGQRVGGDPEYDLRAAAPGQAFRLDVPGWPGG